MPHNKPSYYMLDKLFMGTPPSPTMKEFYTKLLRNIAAVYVIVKGEIKYVLVDIIF